MEDPGKIRGALGELEPGSRTKRQIRGRGGYTGLCVEGYKREVG